MIWLRHPAEAGKDLGYRLRVLLGGSQGATVYPDAGRGTMVLPARREGDKRGPIAGSRATA